jgi:hypothetical protein
MTRRQGVRCKMIKAWSCFSPAVKTWARTAVLSMWKCPTSAIVLMRVMANLRVCSIGKSADLTR